MTAVYLALAAGVVALIVAPGPGLAVLRVLGSVPLVLLAHVLERRRDRARVAVPAGPARTTWYAELFVVTPRGQRVRIRSGLVRGVWATRLDVERELLQRYIAVHGQPAGSLAARAERRA